MAHPFVGIGQCQGDKLGPHGLFEHDVEQRQQAMMQTFLTQLFETGQRVTAAQQLEHFIKNPGCGHVVN